MHTVANITKDIATAYKLDPHPGDVNSYPPIYVYNVRDVMRHLNESDLSSETLERSASEDLVEFLKTFRVQ